MSRCFSFPPPGYEREHRPEDSDILREAKCKEKKHRKEKKDKERRKDTEKETEGGDEKQRDKKDRKGKHRDKKEKNRDKKKDKEDQGKEKEKSGISEESTVAGKLEEESGGKRHTKGHSRGASSFPNEGQCSTLLRGQNGGKSSQSSQPLQVIDDSKFVQELDRGIRDDEISRGSQFLDKVPLRDQEMAARASIGNSSVVPEEKDDDNKIKRIDRKVDPQGLSNEYSRNRLVQNPIPTSTSKFDGIPRPLDEQNGRSLEDEEKFRETGDVKWRGKQNNRDKESKGKEKEKKKDMMLKVETENKKSEQGKLKDCDMLENADNNSINEAKIRKRKDMDTNGFLHESEIRLTKMQKPAPYHLTENGRKIEAIQTASKPSDEMGAASNTGRVDKINQLINGVIEAEKAFNSKPNSCAVAEAPKAPNRDSYSSNKALKVPKIEDPISEVSRPPHPDSKYLAEVLTIPKMADWSDDDDQEWLFRKKSPSKPKVDSTGIEEDLQVWSEAVHIDSADVFALPYVIPY